MSEPYTEADCLPLSALQHLLFCERQCALIHLEGLWVENALTVEGRHMHEKVDEQGSTQAPDGPRVARGLPIRCLRLGLSGRAHVVEFHPVVEAAATSGKTHEQPYPVEYKRGHRHQRQADQVQLCAQAMALEEMFGCEVMEGALFYDKSKRRLIVQFDEPLRSATIQAAADYHALVRERRTPPPVNDARCDHCSLRDHCLPAVTAKAAAVGRYIQSLSQLPS